MTASVHLTAEYYLEILWFFQQLVQNIVIYVPWVHFDKIGFGQLSGDKSEAGCLKCPDIKGVSPAGEISSDLYRT